MRCYLFRGEQVTVFADAPSSITADTVLIENPAELDQTRFPLTRLVAIWNALPGAEPLKRFKDRAAAVKRLWDALEALPASTNRPGSKQAKVLALLRRPDGASMDDLIAVTGWQSHSVRGVLSGVIRKKLGLEITSSRVGETRIYRIAA